MTPDSNSDDSDIDVDEHAEESFEMKSFARSSGECQEAPSVPRDDENYSRSGSDDDGESSYGKHGRQAGNRRPSNSTVQSFELYTPDEERAVVKKFDRKLVPFLALLYMLSFLDRSSMFNALSFCCS